MKYQVWYMKPEWFRHGITGALPQANDLTASHVHLTDTEADGLSALFRQMQGDIWSPFGEARELIKSKGLHHTSMSVGDVAIDDVGNVHVVANLGWKAIGGVKV
jgi:hypothetical protein